MSLALFPSTTFVGILSCRRYAMDLTSKGAEMFGGARREYRLNNDDKSRGPSKSSRRDCVDWARASNVFETELHDILVPRQDAIATDDHSVVGVGVPCYV